MDFSPEFFDLQLQFATRVAELTGEPLGRTLRDYTNLFVRFGCATAREGAENRWAEYVRELESSNDLLDWTHQFWRRNGRGQIGPTLSDRVGCFGYTIECKEQLRLHFVAPDGMEGSPLAEDALRRRASELRQLLAHVPGHISVAGRSWLYNLPRYRSLFPENYLASCVQVPDAWTRLPLWGQFLHADGNVRAAEGMHFRRRLQRAKAVGDLAGCFRYQVLAPSAPASSFQRLSTAP